MGGACCKSKSSEREVHPASPRHTLYVKSDAWEDGKQTKKQPTAGGERGIEDSSTDDDYEEGQMGVYGPPSSSSIPALPPVPPPPPQPEPTLCDRENSWASRAPSQPRVPTRHVTTVTEGTDEQGNRTYNEYTVRKSLGSGRFGEVSLVERQRHPSSPRLDGKEEGPELFAMKQVSRKLLRKDSENKEVEILKRLDHPHAVKLCEVLDDPSRNEIFMIFEYVDGGPIMNLLDNGSTKEPPFDEEECRGYMQQIVEGLQYLHDCNIIHRDIKPENILITKDRTMVKLGDFGVSRLLASEDDGSRETGGTPLFVSPEACRGEFASGKSNDIWALGITLYIFMYGRHPFPHTTSEIQLYQYILNHSIVFPTTPSYSHDLLCLLSRMLERNVLHRITLNEIRNNPWVRGGKAPVPEDELKRIRQSRRNQVFGKRPPPPHTPNTVPEDPTSPVAGESGVKVLIVEDVFLIQKVVAKMLKAVLDVNVQSIECVSDGEDAVKACEETRFDIVLMDVHMSRVSGVAATCRIREHEAAKGLYPTNIVGLTADPHDDIEQLCNEAGMNLVVQKPLQPAKLREVCQQFGIPVKEGETCFSAADFKKGEVRGGGKNNAFLKSYQEHLENSSPAKARPGTFPEMGSPTPVVPFTPSSPDSDVGISSPVEATPTDTPPPSSDANDDNNKIERSMSNASQESSDSVKKGALSSDDMRSRSLQCMRNHQNMYKKKNHDAVFQRLNSTEVKGFAHHIAQMWYNELGWARANALGEREHLELREMLEDNLETWEDELITLNDIVTRSDLLDKVKESPWWEEATKPHDDSAPPQRRSKYEAYAHADKGQRGGMEDFSMVAFNPTALLTGKSADPSELVVGVFDGHGGPYAADYCRLNLLPRLVRAAGYSSSKTLPAALEHAFVTCNSAYFSKIEHSDCDAGTTAIVGVFKDGIMTIANAGDCRAVLGYGGSEAKQLNRIHVCTDDEERAMVEKRGGSIVHYNGSWRVNGVLLVTRALGDVPCRDVLTAQPEVVSFEITSSDEFVVFASDGLWDVMTPAEVCDAVRSARSEIDAGVGGKDTSSQGTVLKHAASIRSKASKTSKVSKSCPSVKSTAQEDADDEDDDEEEEEDEEAFSTYDIIPEALIMEAIERGSHDNVTCVIVFFPQPPPGDD
eukprot:Sspe_Gene.76120::Locus_47567_Transcript_2_2_Confidence_0.667_Length_4109::g.76120::m.76120/K07359/CAMKK2; calcium/calmodulin-dependent protein kinase kinase 2